MLRRLSLLLALPFAACNRSHDPLAHADTVPSEKPAARVAAAPAGPEHPVFSLADNRLLAHATHGEGLVVIAGGASFDKYMNFGAPNMPWRRHQNLDGHRVAVVSDSYARLVVPITSENAKTATGVWARLSSPDTRAIELYVAGKKVSQAKAVPGWQTLAFPIAPGALPAGEHEVQLVSETKGDAESVEWIQIGGDAPKGDAQPGFFDADKQALVLPAGYGLDWYVEVPKAGRLRGDVLGEGCTVDASARPEGGVPISGSLAGADAELDLSPLAGKIVRLSLAASGCAQAELAKAALVVPGAAPTVTRGAAPKHIVFWIMDSLRADRVKPFFPGARPDVPNWEALAKEGTIFKNTYVQGNESKASHSSIWTSQYVANHMVINESSHLPDKWTQIGQAMKKLGLYTAGASANGWIVDYWGFQGGWDAFHNHIHEEDLGTLGEYVWADGKREVEAHAKDPFFLYMGMVDTHVPWKAHDPWFSKYDPDPYDGQYKTYMDDDEEDAVVAGKVHVTDRDKQRVIAFYDSDVSYQDDLIGKVRAQLTTWGIADDTMIVVLADHGDELWENGLLGHGGSLHETLVHIPLAIVYPPIFPAGTVVDEGVDALDLLPTLVDAMQGQPLPDAQGESLIPLAHGVGRGYPRPSFTSMYEDSHAMRIGDWKIVVTSSGGVHVYDVATDHFEKDDVAETRPIERRFLTDAMSIFMLHQREWKKTRWGVASNQTAQLAADLDR